MSNFITSVIDSNLVKLQHRLHRQPGRRRAFSDEGEAIRAFLLRNSSSSAVSVRRATLSVIVASWVMSRKRGPKRC